MRTHDEILFDNHSTTGELRAELLEAEADLAKIRADLQDAIRGRDIWQTENTANIELLDQARADLSEARLALQQIDFMKGIPNTVHDIAREALGLTATPPAAPLAATPPTYHDVAYEVAMTGAGDRLRAMRAVDLPMIACPQHRFVRMVTDEAIKRGIEAEFIAALKEARQ